MNTVHTTPDMLERIAHKSGHSIEIYGDRAYLAVGSVVWVAELPPVMSARQPIVVSA